MQLIEMVSTNHCSHVCLFIECVQNVQVSPLLDISEQLSTTTSISSRSWCWCTTGAGDCLQYGGCTGISYQNSNYLLTELVSFAK